MPVSYKITYHAMLMKSLCSYIINSYNMINCLVVFFLFKYDLHPIFADEPFKCAVNAHNRNDSAISRNASILLLSDKTMFNFGNEYFSIYFRTFVPSFRLVRQTILHTPSCQIMVQKSEIVLGFGPDQNNKI